MGDVVVVDDDVRVDDVDDVRVDDVDDVRVDDVGNLG